jgi:carboxypeptidase family protein/TonB-dependent receptor-like protein
MGSFLRALLLFHSALLACLPVFAGTSGELRGRILDKDLHPLAGVTVRIDNDLLVLVGKGTVSDGTGAYRISGLPAGAGYRVRVSLATFSTMQFSDVSITADDVTTLDVVLLPASEIQETVRVPGKAGVVDTESVLTSSTFTSQFIAGLPLLGRNYQDVLTLAPGVVDPDHTGNPNVHGARSTDFITLVDGVSTTDPLTGRYGQNLNIESIQEIEVITSGATADFGRAQGGFANIVTKSGGNEFQGSFKFYARSHRLDRDGAGRDPPDLTGGLRGEAAANAIRFTDLYPFLSLSGAIRKNYAWFYTSGEFIQVETPVHDLTAAFVTRTRGYREFLKTTWQLTNSHKLALSVILDRERLENQGITSLKDLESGYFFKRGGPTYTLRETAVFNPSLLLESSLSWFDNSFEQASTLSPDTNHNGVLFVDDRPELGGNGDGIFQVRERDPGEDWDRDHDYDIFEDRNGNRALDSLEDKDGDRRVTPVGGCEGTGQEDRNCNGLLDEEVDLDLNGAVDPDEDAGIPCAIPGACPEGVVPGTRGNGRFDTEDRSGDGVLDTVPGAGLTPFPFWNDRNGNGTVEVGEFRSPLPPDRNYTTDRFGRTTGPFPYQYGDHRKRLTVKEELSLYGEGYGGSHDIRMGAVFEHEGYDRDTLVLPIVQAASSGIQISMGSSSPGKRDHGILAYMAVPGSVNNTATGNSVGLYLQDRFKPFPNLSLGLGIRADLEAEESFGYTPFDPVSERRRFNAVMALIGIQSDTDFYLSQPVLRLGLRRDPLYTNGIGDAIYLATIESQIKDVAPDSLSHPAVQVDLVSASLARVFGRSDLDELARQGVRIRRPQGIRIQNANVAPRLSLSWDPRGDGKSKGFASWGRYYDKLFLNSIVMEEGPDSVTRGYAFDPDGVDFRGVPDNQVGLAISQSSLTAFQIDRGISTPYDDELTLGFEREIAPEVSLSLTYVRRDYRKQLQTIDVNHRVQRDVKTGQFLDLIGAYSCEMFPDPPRVACANQSDNLPDLFIENPFFNRVLRLGNFNSQFYRGWELKLVRRLSRKWQMQASYTHSRAYGDAETYNSEVGDDPSLAEFEPGYLLYDQRHAIKLHAVAYLPQDWQIGTSSEWASGFPYSSQLRTGASDDVGFFQDRLLYGHVGPGGLGFFREARNTHRNRSTYMFNARVQKNFTVAKTVASGFFEIFNLLNSDDLRVYNIRQVPARVLPAEPGGFAEVIPGYEIIEGERRFGRRFEFGIQIDF